MASLCFSCQAVLKQSTMMLAHDDLLPIVLNLLHPKATNSLFPESRNLQLADPTQLQV